MILNYFIYNTFSSFSKTLSFVEKKNKFKLIKLIILLIIQSILDVIAIASIIPLLYILENKGDLKENIYNLLDKYNFNFININDINLIFYIPILVIFIMLISTITRLYIVFKTNQFIEEIRFHTSSKLMRKYINRNFYYKNKSEIAKSVLSEVDQFIIIVFQPFMFMITNIFLLLGIVIYIFYANTLAAILSLIILLNFYLIFYLFTKKILNKEGIKNAKANKGRFKIGIESLSCIKDIKLYSAENFFAKRFNKYSQNYSFTNANYMTLLASPKYLLEMIVFISLSGSILIIATRDIIDLNSLPLLGTFAFAAYKSQPALSNIIYGINSLEYGSKIISNLYEELNNDNNLNLIKNERKICNLNKKEICIKINNLEYKFKNKKVINNLNLEINSKSLFILMGESGSGKSTILNIISGLIRPQKGNVTFNKKLFINKLPVVSYVQQDFSLFDATIAENVAFGIEIMDIDIKQLNYALKEAEIYNFIYSLDKNIYENISENGNNLSEGQKQRILLARAIYFKPDILLLDEPTSSLDGLNEKKIIKTILKLSKKITIVMATHKINYIPEKTQIAFINKQKNIDFRNIKELRID